MGKLLILSTIDQLWQVFNCEQLWFVSTVMMDLTGVYRLDPTLWRLRDTGS